MPSERMPSEMTPSDRPAFASSADLGEKTISFDEIGKGVYAYTAEGDPNTGVVVGDDSVLVFDAQATPKMAETVIARVRQVTDKPIHHVVLSHYHAVRVLGAPAYGAREIICSDVARAMIVERGEQDKASEIGRFPRLFQGADSIRPGLTWPTTTFSAELSIWLGKREVRLMKLGRGHTAGDIVAWIPDAQVAFAGDLVEYGATPYCGDAHFTDWPATLDKLSALGSVAMVPGRGAALTSAGHGRGRHQWHARLPQRPVRGREAQRCRRPHAARDLRARPCRIEAGLWRLGHLRALPALQRQPRL